ncbi:MAG: aminoglycoside phosphotransferase family protein [Chloroflexia bacterium]|nr:aminoglycoside phosphotransferase family protein [Chloroflexia bacterium]
MASEQQAPRSDTAPVAVDADRAEAFLVSRFGPGVREVTRIGYGEWSRAYAFRYGGVDHVARFGAFVEDFDKDRRAARYGSDALPIPAVTEIGQAFDGYYAISERAFGDFIDDLDDTRMRATLPSLFAALDAAREADLTSSAGYGGWAADGMATRHSWRATLLAVAEDDSADRIIGWRERLRQSSPATAAFEEGMDCLQSLLPYASEARHLIHSDLLHFNVLVANDRVSAVVDWGCSMYGDFLYDVAWLVFWSHWYPAWQRIDFREEAMRHFETIGLDVPHFEQRLRLCQLHVALDSLKYNAFMERWDQLDVVAGRTLLVARAER